MPISIESLKKALLFQTDTMSKIPLEPSISAFLKAILAKLDNVESSPETLDNQVANVVESLKGLWALYWQFSANKGYDCFDAPFDPLNLRLLEIVKVLASESENVCKIIAPDVTTPNAAWINGDFKPQYFFISKDKKLIAIADLMQAAAEDSNALFEAQHCDAYGTYHLKWQDLLKLRSLANQASITYYEAIEQYHTTTQKTLTEALNELAAALHNCQPNKNMGYEWRIKPSIIREDLLAFQQTWLNLPTELRSICGSLEITAYKLPWGKITTTLNDVINAVFMYGNIATLSEEEKNAASKITDNAHSLSETLRQLPEAKSTDLEKRKATLKVIEEEPIIESTKVAKPNFSAMHQTLLTALDDEAQRPSLALAKQNFELLNAIIDVYHHAVIGSDVTEEIKNLYSKIKTDEDILTIFSLKDLAVIKFNLADFLHWLTNSEQVELKNNAYSYSVRNRVLNLLDNIADTDQETIKAIDLYFKNMPNT